MKGLAIVLLLAISTASFLQVSLGAVYQVGDSNGWTIHGNLNYTKWAESTHFLRKDIIQFVYNPKLDNVLVVTERDYKSCDASNPISSFVSGNDSFIIETLGPHYVITGTQTHCKKGQKVNIYVNYPTLSEADVGIIKLSLTNNVAPATVPNNTHHVAPAPTPSNANSLIVKHGFVVAVFAIFISNMFFSK